MATLIAQGCSNGPIREDLTNQLKYWKENGTSTRIDGKLWKIYQLLSGDINGVMQYVEFSMNFPVGKGYLGGSIGKDVLLCCFGLARKIIRRLMTSLICLISLLLSRRPDLQSLYFLKEIMVNYRLFLILKMILFWLLQVCGFFWFPARIFLMVEFPPKKAFD